MQKTNPSDITLGNIFHNVRGDLPERSGDELPENKKQSSTKNDQNLLRVICNTLKLKTLINIEKNCRPC